MGGDLKRNMDSEKEKEMEAENVEKKIQELRDDIFREAAEIVSDFPGSRFAIFMAPPNFKPDDISVHTFGYPPSVAAQPSLEDKCPVPVTEEAKEDEEPPRKRYWWEDEPYHLMNAEELDAAIDGFERLRDHLLFRLEVTSRAQHLQNQVAKARPKP